MGKVRNRKSQKLKRARRVPLVTLSQVERSMQKRVARAIAQGFLDRGVITEFRIKPDGMMVARLATPPEPITFSFEDWKKDRAES